MTLANITLDWYGVHIKIREVIGLIGSKWSDYSNWRVLLSSWVIAGKYRLINIISRLRRIIRWLKVIRN